MPTPRQRNPIRPLETPDAVGVGRPVSPGILAMAILLALTASVAAAGVVEGSDPARYDRREAPRELTVRWLSDAVAKAARDLASAESRPSAAAIPVRALACDAQAECLAETQDRPDTAEIVPGPPLRETARQGLISLPPPALR